MTARAWSGDQLFAIYKIADLTEMARDAKPGSDQREAYSLRARTAIFQAETQAFIGRDDVKPLLRAVESGSTRDDVYELTGAPRPDAHAAPEDEATA